MVTHVHSETAPLGVLLTTKPPATLFVAIGAFVLAITMAIVSGAGETTMDSGLWALIGKWCLANLSAAVAVTLVIGAASLASPERWYSGPHKARALALSYGTYLLAGVIGGFARLGPIHLLGIDRSGTGPLHEAASVGAIVSGTLTLGFLANQFHGLIERIRSQQRALSDRMRELAEEIDERKRAEQALGVSEERFRRTAETLAAIQSSMAEGLIVLDSAGIVLQVNTAARAIMGVALHQAPGKSIDKVFNASEQVVEPPEAVQTLLDCLKGPPDSVTTHQLVVHSQRARNVEMTIFPIVLGKAAGMAGILMRDVTREREVDRRRNTFVSVASHELRTPLTAMMGYSHLLLRKNPPPSRRRAWLQRMYEGTRRFAAIIDDLLNVSRIQSGEMELRQQRVSLPGLLEEVLVEARGITDNHDLSFEIAANTPEVTVDQGKLAQVLANLVDNAIKYSPQGGQVRLSTTVDRERDRVLIAVADEGLGISPEQVDDIFETFHRIRRPETEHIRGSGLGLDVVKELLERMYGEVWVESELNKGSTFFVALPIAPVGAPVT